MTTTPYDTDNPLISYAQKNLWGNPEENHQYQCELVRVSTPYGERMNFPMMGKWRALPKRNETFHIFSMAGLHPAYWSIRNQLIGRNPLDRWINLASLMKVRGIQIDIYNTRGFQYSRAHAWAMVCYDGLIMIALQKYNPYEILENDKMYYRCYDPSIGVSVGDDALAELNNPFVYQTMTFENSSELATFTTRYNTVKARPGFTAIFHNGVYWSGAPNQLLNLAIGDLVELWHDPTVLRVERYNYASLKDYYSTMDKKRKLILHPPKANNFTLRFFDDNDYYLINATTKRGLYIHRNNVTTVRQLTHVDVSVATDVLEVISDHIKDLNDLTKTQIMVLVRNTDWVKEWPNDHQRIRYLYKLPDADILKAMTGERATVPEWTADGLEGGSVMAFTRSKLKQATRVPAALALGYNAITRAISETPLKIAYQAGIRGVEVPESYRRSFTAWEHDANGQLIGIMNQSNVRYYSPYNAACAMVEFTLGQTGRRLAYKITVDDYALDYQYDYRVYKQAWSVSSKQLVGEMTDITGDSKYYEVVNGILKWKAIDTVNERGIILFNSASLSYTFALDHIDHSLSFDLTVVYEDGGLVFPIANAQVDLWMNRRPLIDKVDWIMKGRRMYIHNKEFIQVGAQEITVRAHGFHDDPDNPKSETELGFVDGGVIGRFPRWNLREDRVTRTVINGALYITSDVPQAENQAPGQLAATLNGRPYMVKHVYCPIKFVEPFENYSLYDRSRVVDQRVSDYLTKYLPKKELTPPTLPNLQDKYKLFSQLLNVVVNGLINRIIKLPTMTGGATAYSEQSVYDAIKPYLWWLEFDPVKLGYDRRYFAILPFANPGKLIVTAKELQFINQVNATYLESVCVIEGYFLVNNNIR